MLTTKSRDGIYILSAPDTAKNGWDININERDYDSVQDVYIEAVEGKEAEANLHNLAEAIYYDYFGKSLSYGLGLLAKVLKCHVKVGDKRYKYLVNRYTCIDDTLSSLSYDTHL